MTRVQPKPTFSPDAPSAKQRRAQLVECAKRRGIRVTKNAYGAFRIHGAGVDILTVDLAYVGISELAAKPGALVRRG